MILDSWEDRFGLFLFPDNLKKVIAQGVAEIQRGTQTLHLFHMQ